MISLRRRTDLADATRRVALDGGEIVVKGFWFFLVAAAVGGAVVWIWKGPAAGAATAWFVSPIPPPPLSPI